MWISIPKKRQQISKFTKSTKYTQPKQQMLTTQYACTGGTTTIPDVTTIVVTKKGTQILLRCFASFNQWQLFILRELLYFPCLNLIINTSALSIDFILSQLFILNLYKVPITTCRSQFFHYVSHRVLLVFKFSFIS